jgi:hypothetical protein
MVSEPEGFESSQALVSVCGRRTAAQREMPQVLAVPQEAALWPAEKPDPPLTLEAKMEIFLEISLLPQDGQFTSAIAFELRTNSSKGRPQSPHTNSNNGIGCSWSSVK